MTEVAIGLQFAPIQGLRQPHIGLFWSRLRSRFPTVADQHPLPHLPLVAALPQPFQIQFSQQSYPLPRTWLISEDGTQLVQLQADRLVFNWRGEGVKYPRYDTLRPLFESVLGDFQAFLAEEGLDPTVPEQIELAYVNTIVAEHLSAVLDGLNVPSLEPSGVLDQEHLVMSQRISSGDNAAVLLVQAQSRQGPDQDQVLLTLTFRADVVDDQGGSAASMRALFDQARESIVRSFAKITHPDLRAGWGEKT